MKKIVLINLFIFISSLSSAQTRIISLKPNITEILFALDLGAQIVGVTEYCHYPEAAQKLPKVSDYIHLNVEKAISLKPQILIGSKENSSQKEIQFMQVQGFQVELYPFNNLTETYQSILAIGAKFNKSKEAQALVQQMQYQAGQLQQRHAAVQTGMIVVGYQPLMVAGGGTLISEMFQFLNIENIFFDSKIPYPRISEESLLKLNPDVIINLSMGSDQNDFLELSKKYPMLKAVKNKKLYSFNMDLFHASPRMIQGLQLAYKTIYKN